MKKLLSFVLTFSFLVSLPLLALSETISKTPEPSPEAEEIEEIPPKEDEDYYYGIYSSDKIYTMGVYSHEVKGDTVVAICMITHCEKQTSHLITYTADLTKEILEYRLSHPEYLTGELDIKPSGITSFTHVRGPYYSFTIPFRINDEIVKNDSFIMDISKHTDNSCDSIEFSVLTTMLKYVKSEFISPESFTIEKCSAQLSQPPSASDKTFFKGFSDSVCFCVRASFSSPGLGNMYLYSYFALIYNLKTNKADIFVFEDINKHIAHIKPMLRQGAITAEDTSETNSKILANWAKLMESSFAIDPFEVQEAIK